MEGLKNTRNVKNHNKQSRELIDKKSASEAMKPPGVWKSSRAILFRFNDGEVVQRKRAILRVIFLCETLRGCFNLFHCKEMGKMMVGNMNIVLVKKYIFSLFKQTVTERNNKDYQPLCTVATIIILNEYFIGFCKNVFQNWKVPINFIKWIL